MNPFYRGICSAFSFLPNNASFERREALLNDCRVDVLLSRSWAQVGDALREGMSNYEISSEKNNKETDL